MTEKIAEPAEFDENAASRGFDEYMAQRGGGAGDDIPGGQRLDVPGAESPGSTGEQNQEGGGGEEKPPAGQQRSDGGEQVDGAGTRKWLSARLNRVRKPYERALAEKQARIDELEKRVDASGQQQKEPPQQRDPEPLPGADAQQSENAGGDEDIEAIIAKMPDVSAYDTGAEGEKKFKEDFEAWEAEVDKATAGGDPEGGQAEAPAPGDEPRLAAHEGQAPAEMSLVEELELDLQDSMDDQDFEDFVSEYNSGRIHLTQTMLRHLADNPDMSGAAAKALLEKPTLSRKIGRLSPSAQRRKLSELSGPDRGGGELNERGNAQRRAGPVRGQPVGSGGGIETAGSFEEYEARRRADLKSRGDPLFN